MHYGFDRIIDRTHTGSVKYEFMKIQEQAVNSDTLPFWIADMDFMCPQPLLDAVKQRADQLILGYSMADTAYHQAVCSWMERRFSWTIDPADIFISSGVVQALIHLILALTKPGDGIIIQRPVYYPFTSIIEYTGRRLVNNALRSSGGHAAIDFADLTRRAADPGVSMMLFCSPHNPTGRVWTEEELQRVGKICLKNNVILVADEIHCDLLRRGVRHTPMAQLFGEEDTIIACTAPTKTFNAAGLQISNILIRNPDFQQKWSAQAGPEFPSPLALAAVTAAYNQGEDWLEQLRIYLDDNFAFLAHFLADHLSGATCCIPEGTYLAWIDFSGYSLSDQELDRILLEKANVLLEGGTIFGPEGSGFQRMNIACPRSILDQGLRRISAALGT